MTDISTDSELETGIFVPLYSYPGLAWQMLARTKKANSSVPIIAIINPRNGPGTSRDPNYVQGIDTLRSVGVTVLGYVYTNYGVRPRQSITMDIDAYRKWYSLDGILFDEMPNIAGLENYYAALNDYAKSFGYSVTIGNPGAAIPPSYAGTADVLCIYENVGLPLLSDLASRTVNCDRSKFALISIGVPTLDPAFVSAASKYGSWIYVTDANLPNPYDVLPSYFARLVKSVSKRPNLPFSLPSSPARQ